MKKKVLITGASGGIGFAIAKKFYENGYFVILSGRNLPKLKQNAEKFEDNYDVLSCDLSIEKDVSELSKEINYKYDGIDILVNNAGITEDSLFMRMDYLKWNRVINTNLNSNFLLTNSFIRKMIKKKWGRIINITSVVGHTGNPGQANYCASKQGIIGMSKSIALEVARKGITVNCISPGFIETEMTQKLNEAQKESILNSIPIGRVGYPHEVANCVFFLSSEDSSYITGQTIHINGGITMI
tara:strand:- start:6 stop:731 length:726 start_codon:yes stop_codon:yes gene_type:complete